MFARIENGKVAEYPLYIGDIKLRFKDTSFTSPFTPPEGYVAVQPTDRPSTEYDETAQELPPAEINGEWTQRWDIRKLTPEELAERDAAAAESVRMLRDSKLLESDWTQLPDAPTDHTAWAEYRQELRDVTSQPGFPREVIWPEPPAA